ncbi:MAG: DUF3320 domain-containing protein [Planctomycetota bacterium]|nr:DUF3320 domain-containing protein [Planctomycetota bacterium]
MDEPDTPTPPTDEPTPAPAPEPEPPAERASPIGWKRLETEGLAVELEYDAHVNYAMQQNAVPVVKAVRIRNLGEEPLKDVVVGLWAAPELAPRIELRAAEIPAGAAHRFEPVDLPFSATRLVNKDEREQAQLWIEVACGDEVRHRLPHPLEVLAYSEWAGARSLPEILAAFVLPNHPDVERLLASARDRLAQATGDPTLEGYRAKDPARVKAVVEAVYGAARDLDLTYVSPPASFEQGGQKIRMPERMLETSFATCLDLVCFVGAALEQAGFHPLLVLLEDHALLGVWLTDESFAHATIDEVLRLRKRVQIDTLLMIETTGLTARPPMDFAAACKAGARQLDDAKRFAYAVDVRAARRERIRPLPGRIRDDRYTPVEATPDAASDEGGDVGVAPAPVIVETHVAEPTPEPPLVGAARLDRWKRKLLDLTLRNRLLNFRPTRSSLPLTCPDIHRLEDLLSSGTRFRIRPEPDLMGAEDPRDAALERERTGEDPEAAYLLAEMDDGRLHADLDEELLEKRLVFIDRAARTSLEEGGANTLYLALGFLHWYETRTSETERLAPVLLLPLTLTRAGVREGYRLELADDEPQVNVTLLQKLAAEFDVPIDGLEELETDESGVDVARLLKRLREAVLPLERWEVREEAVIGLFSFTKHLMWRDLDRRAPTLMQNEVVSHLVERPGEPIPSTATFPEARALDAAHDPADTFCPLDADSSQLCAIHAAADGHTFVLEGPPGTGKSQTIANLVAHALATGKRVLFVSEKMAALNVVYKRLAKVGLGPFCLELHSNKARKRGVLEQLGEALAYVSEDGGEAWPERTQKLAGVRQELGSYVDVLHRPRSFGVSAYEGLCRLLAADGAPEVQLAFDTPDALSAGDVTAMEEAVAAMAAALGEIEAPAAHPFRASRITEWTPSLPTRVADEATGLAADATRLDEASRALAEVLDVEPRAFAWRAIDDLFAVATTLSSGEPVPRALFTGPRIEASAERIEGWLGIVEAHATASAEVGEAFDDGIYDLPLGDLHRRLEKARASGWLMRWWRGRKPKQALAAVARGALADLDPLIASVARAEDVLARRENLAAAQPDASALLGALWRGADTDAAAVRRAVATCTDLRYRAARLAEGDPERLVALRERWQALVDAGEDMWAPGARPTERLAALREAQTAYDAHLDPLTEMLALDTELLFGVPEQPAFCERVAALARGFAEHAGSLRAWAAWRRARETATAAQIEPLGEAVDAGVLDAATLAPALERGLFRWWIDALYEAEPLLRGFSRAEQEARVARFRELDTQVRDLSQAVVGERLATRLPRGATALSSSSTSELGIVARELKKQRRHLPIRTLFQRIPNLLPRLKPCMLMSPLSVAQYLAPDFPPFDLVVFDEASQIPTWDAVGAIARGKELIVVGDSKQLPPTTFFMKTGEDELQDEDDIEELESILDECLAVSMPSLRLGWHYRSRHESLIAFSNTHYYDGNLFTFPAAAHEAPHLGVSRVDVPDGVYEKGRSRANRKEAEAVVAEVVRRLRDPMDQARSIGVVTFSIPQQMLILDLLDDARRADPSLDRFFHEGAVEEPLFVKNLENVQGDERDVILFSVCYGPDDQGRIAMNFGPLNRDGGERRLNVAVTRAREQVILFSTLKADDIDLARTQAVGVKHLKAFLEYAERGAETLDQALLTGVRGGAPTHVETALATALAEAGLAVVPRVGCSGYRIDLGIADPDDPGRFLLGVETDGPMYATGPTARDRDRTRHGVLRSLGWHLERVWATDWWQEPDKQVARIAERVRLLDTPAPPEPAQPEQSDAEPETQTDTETTVGAQRPAPETPPAAALPPGAFPYRAWRPSGRAGKAENFHKGASNERVARAVRDVLDAEAPIALDVLIRRVAERWSVERVTEKVTERVVEQVRGVPHRWIDVGEVTFLWREDQEPASYEGYRVAAEGEDPPREVEHVPLEEIVNAAHAVLVGHVAMPSLDLARETARVLGYTRLGSTVQRLMEAGVERLVGTGRATRSDDQIVIT